MGLQDRDRFRDTEAEFSFLGMTVALALSVWFYL